MKLLSKLNDSSIQSAVVGAIIFIIVANHTVIKITDFNDCKPSASWGTCMPMAEGYIKKGVLQHEKDYCNNIIGLPDNQKRTLYLFD